MSYHISRTVALSFEDAVAKVISGLKGEGFGVLTDIDVRATLKEKLGVDFRKYRILGACNPRFAHEALAIEDRVGVLLPCNVVIQEHEPGRVEVSAVDPLSSMQVVGNPRLKGLGEKVREKLRAVIDAV